MKLPETPSRVQWVVSCVLALCAMAPGAHGALFRDPVAIATIQSGAVDEVSGMVASRSSPRVLWAHNDGGDSARIFAVNTAGRLLGIFNIQGAGALDWEDIALGVGPEPGRGYLYIADTGDNTWDRGTVRGPAVIHRIPEPIVSPDQARNDQTVMGVERFYLSYPDGPVDAEAMFVDPLNGDLYVISKHGGYSQVYRAAADALVAEQTAMMEYLGTLPWGQATGADISADGREILIRAKYHASLWLRPEGMSIWEALTQMPLYVPIAGELQGEAIAFDWTDRGYLTLGEGEYQPLYYQERRVPGDANADRWVSDADYTIWADNYGMLYGWWGAGDFNDDGLVTDADYTLWADNYDHFVPPLFGGGPVPEPTTLALLATASLLLRRRREIGSV